MPDLNESATSTSTPNNETPSSSAPPISEPTPWRAPASAPSIFAGKTAEEVLAEGLRLQQIAERVPLPQAPPTPQNPYGTDNPYDDTWVTGRQLLQFQQQAAQQYLNPMLENSAQLAWQLATAQAPDVMAKYGTEALQYWNQLPPAHRNLEGAKTVLNQVRGNHFQELIEAAKHEAGVSFRSGSAPPAMQQQAQKGQFQNLDDEAIPAEWRAKAAEKKITMETVKEFCRINGITVKDYFEKSFKHSIGGQ